MIRTLTLIFAVALVSVVGSKCTIQLGKQWNYTVSILESIAVLWKEAVIPLSEPPRDHTQDPCITPGNRENDVDTQRYLKNDKELSSLRGKFGLFFEPDEKRGESRTAFQHILTFLNKRPAATKPTAPAEQNVCGESDSPSEWNTGDGYSAKSLLPAIIGSMKEDALYNIF